MMSLKIVALTKATLASMKLFNLSFPFLFLYQAKICSLAAQKQHLEEEHGKNSKMRYTTFYPLNQKPAWYVPKGVDTHNLMNVIN